MAVTQAELNAALVALKAAQDAEVAKVNGFIADVLAAFTKLEAKIASLGGQVAVDLAPEMAIVQAAMQPLADNATAIDSADAQAKTEAAQP